MGRLVTTAIRAGQWVDIPLPKEETSIIIESDFGEGLTKEIVDMAKLMEDPDAAFQVLKGAEDLEANGLVERVADKNGNLWLKPQKSLVNFITARLAPYAPQT